MDAKLLKCARRLQTFCTFVLESNRRVNHSSVFGDVSYRLYGLKFTLREASAIDKAVLILLRSISIEYWTMDVITFSKRK